MSGQCCVVVIAQQVLKPGTELDTSLSLLHCAAAPAALHDHEAAVACSWCHARHMAAVSLRYAGQPVLVQGRAACLSKVPAVQGHVTACSQEALVLLTKIFLTLPHNGQDPRLSASRVRRAQQ